MHSYLKNIILGFFLFIGLLIGFGLTPDELEIVKANKKKYLLLLIFSFVFGIALFVIANF